GAQHRVGGPLDGRRVLAARDAADAAGDARLLEDRLGEVGPCAVTCGGDVVDAERPAHDVLDGGGEMPDVGRTATLVVDDGDLVALGREPQHRAHEVVAG